MIGIAQNEFQITREKSNVEKNEKFLLRARFFFMNYATKF